jgi:hypothetical protein
MPLVRELDPCIIHVYYVKCCGAHLVRQKLRNFSKQRAIHYTHPFRNFAAIKVNLSQYSVANWKRLPAILKRFIHKRKAWVYLDS